MCEKLKIAGQWQTKYGKKIKIKTPKKEYARSVKSEKTRKWERKERGRVRDTDEIGYFSRNSISV